MILLPALLIAGGSSFLGTLSIPPMTDLPNHTLAGEKIMASNVVCRSRWGTPMPPDGRAGYSLIAPIKKSLIRESLWIPPLLNDHPVRKSLVATNAPAVLPAPAAVQKSVNKP